MSKIITDNLDVWTSALLVKSAVGRGSNGKLSAYGIQKLRELILELAVRGKLVPQDADEEPAQKLLERISAEKARLVAEGKVGKCQPLPEIDAAEIPFEIPEQWEWVRLGDLGEIFNGNSISKRAKEAKYTNIENGLPFIATKDVGYGWQELDYENGVSIPEEEPNFKVAHKGAVLICAEGGSAGKKCGIADRDICFGNKLYAIELYADVAPDFLLANYLEPAFIAQFLKKMTGIIGGISLAKFKQLLIPLPSVSEQHRIVASVGELMAHCDQLEQQQTHSLELHQMIVETLLDTLIGVASAREMTEAWDRIGNHFDTLFTTENSIDQLKQAILQLAVKGLLASHNGEDENVSTVLARLEESGGNPKVRRSVPTEATKSNTVDESSLPDTWVIESTARLLHLGVIIDLKDGNHGANHPKASEFTEQGLPFITAAQVSEDGMIDYDGAYKVSGEPLQRLRVGFAKPGDVIYTHKGSVGRVAICTQDCVLSPQTTYYRLNTDILSAEFLRIVLLSQFFRAQVDEVKRQTTRDFVSIKAQYQFFLRVPPLAEQHRIVTKVEELVVLCDTLKARLFDTQTTQVHLADAIVEQAIA